MVHDQTALDARGRPFAPVFLKDIQPEPDALTVVDYSDKLNPNEPLMAGRFYQQAWAGGVSLQVVDAVEQQDTITRSLTVPTLSMSMIFTGRVECSFAQHRYRLEPNMGPICSMVINHRHELITRHLYAGMTIQKVNVDVPRDWLESHCQSAGDRQQVERWFDRSQVISWRPDSRLQVLMEQLWRQASPLTLLDRLQSEKMTLDTLATCLEQLELFLQQQVRPSECLQVEPLRQSLKSRLDELLQCGYGLPDIAAQLNMSERTLQRKFKARYRQTVASYLKHKRLELAKKALLVNQLSVAEAAHVAGYNHCSNFVSAFKREYGITPTEFIGRHRYQLKS